VCVVVVVVGILMVSYSPYIHTNERVSIAVKEVKAGVRGTYAKEGGGVVLSAGMAAVCECVL
jgi:hypothetical protein